MQIFSILLYSTIRLALINLSESIKFRNGSRRGFTYGNLQIRSLSLPCQERGTSLTG